MKTKTRYSILYGIRIFLMVFWLYVALDKLWDLSAFHSALLRQPFPDWWADILYWALPLTELGIALSLLFAKERDVATPTKAQDLRHRVTLCLSKGGTYLLSALLLFAFTIYIALGVAGLYAERPCGCASIFSGLTWSEHLVVNIVLFSLSILGWYLTGPTTPMDSRRVKRGKTIQLFQSVMLLLSVPIYFVLIICTRRFPMRFAPFPGRPVQNKPKLYVYSLHVKKTVEA